MVVWLKRAITSIPLLRLIAVRAWLARRGADMGPLVVIEDCTFEGDPSNLSIGRESFIGAGTQFALHDRIRIGERVVINRNVEIFTASHSLRDPRWQSRTLPVVIEDYAWIASGAMLLPGVTIGRGAVVGAGAVVRRDVPAFALAIGNPASIVEGARSEHLDYCPVRLCAPFEAWLGKEMS